MSALKEFANFISLNVANLAATYDRLQVESSQNYPNLPADKRMVRARQLIKTVAEASTSGTPDLLYRLFDGRTPSPSNQPGQNQFPSPLAEIECLGQTLTPVVTNLEAGKFLWQMLSETRTIIFRSATSPLLVGAPETVTQNNISANQQPQDAGTTEYNLLRTILDNLPDYLYAKDAESRFVFLNKATAELLGASSVDEVIGKTDFDFLSPDQAAQFRTDEQALLKSGQPRLNYEEQLIDPTTKQIHWVLTSKIPLQNEQGEILGLIGINRDITSHKQLELQVQESLSRRTQHIQIITEIAQQLSANIPNSIDFYRRVVNLVWERLGYDHVHFYTLTEEGLVLQEGAGEVGHRLKEAGHTIVLNAEKSVAVRAVGNGKAVLVPDVAREPAWLPHPLLPATKAELAVPISLGGEVIGVLDIQSNTVGGLNEEDKLLLEGLAGQIAIAVDSRRAYLAEKEARRQYQQILDGIVDMVLVKGPKSRIVWANKAFRDYYNMINEQLQELIDAPFNEPDYTQQYIKDDEYVFTSGETLDIPQEPVTRFDGEVRLFHTVKSALRDADGKIIMTVGVSRDITGQRQTEAERERLLAEAQRRARREQTIRTITERMRTANNLEQLVKITAQELGQQLSAGHTLVELGVDSEV